MDRGQRSRRAAGTDGSASIVGDGAAVGKQQRMYGPRLRPRRKNPSMCKTFSLLPLRFIRLRLLTAWAPVQPSRVPLTRSGGLLSITADAGSDRGLGN